MAVSYYKANEAQDAVIATAREVGNLDNVRVIWHSKPIVPCADPHAGIVNLSRLTCADGFTEDELVFLRSRSNHEFGHCAFSKGVAKSEWPTGTLHEIWNALEDRRMEHQFGAEYPGIQATFRRALELANRDIGKKANDGEIKAPLWEALVAMSFQSEGSRPCWMLSPKAQTYYNAAYNTFVEWRRCADDREALELAKKVRDILSKANQDWNEENGKPKAKKQEKKQGKKSDGKGKKDDGDEKEQGKEKGQSKKAGKKDQDEEEGEEEGEGREAGAAGEDQDDDGEGQESGNAEGDEDGEKGEGKGDGAGEDSEEGDEDGEEGEGQGGGRPGDFDDEDEDGKGGGDGAKADDDDATEGQGKGSDSSDSDADGKGDGEGDDDSGENETPERHDGAEGNGMGGNKAGGGHRDELPEDEEADEGSEIPDEKVEENLKKDMKGDNPLEESGNEACQQAMERIAAEAFEAGDTPYTSMKHLDEHNVPDGDKEAFKKMRGDIGAGIFTLTRTLEQALRAMAMARRLTGQRTGKLDTGRLVQVVKSLSKNVFEQTKQGTKLDTAVSLVIDESGSMWACGEIAKVVTAMGEALAACGIPFEVVGATTKWGSGAAILKQAQGFTRVNPIVYQHYKAFGEQWPQVAHRVTDISARVHHVDGEVVEHAARRLANRKETRKVVISMSDGDPCAGQCNDQEMAKNLVRVCERSRKSGIEVYSLSIGTDSPARYYGKKYSIVLGKAEFGQEFAKSFVKLLTEGRMKMVGV